MPATCQLHLSTINDYGSISATKQKPVTIAEWSKVLPLTAVIYHGCLDHITLNKYEKVSSDLLLGSDFAQVLRFSPPMTNGQKQFSLNMTKRDDN